MNLTQQDEQLLNTQFDAETEKLAEAKANSIQEAYLYGLEKIAKEVADERDEEDKKEEKKEEPKKEEKMDEESEKAAAELGAFIERGFFDGLRKLGSERHGDESYYIEPFILKKIAMDGSDLAALGILGGGALGLGALSGHASDVGLKVDAARRGIADKRETFIQKNPKVTGALSLGIAPLASALQTMRDRDSDNEAVRAVRKKHPIITGGN